MITKQTKCEICRRQYSRPLGQVGVAICTECGHKPEAAELCKRVAEAGRLGKKAFDEGRTSVPALDKDLNDLLKGAGNNCLPILTAWTQAWHQANIDAPVFFIEPRGPR